MLSRGLWLKIWQVWGIVLFKAVVWQLSHKTRLFIIFKCDFQDEKLDAGPTPPDLSKLNLLSLNTPVVFDSSGWFWNFGDVSQQPNKAVVIGDTVSATFVSITYLKYGVFPNTKHDSNYIVLNVNPPWGISLIS